ncbi:MAG: hypothetical protein KGO22_03735 [Gammaproteobacteria bacterium]|nr:hypothetical protein [Gammaproteobacteria bacterium]
MNISLAALLRGPTHRSDTRLPGVLALGAALIGLAAGPAAMALERPAPAGAMAGAAGIFGSLSAAIAGSFEPHGHAWRIDLTDLPFAGGRVQIRGVLRPSGWSLTAHAVSIDLSEAAQIARVWVSLPAGYKVSGHADLLIELTGQRGQTTRVEAHSSDLSLTNQSGTIVVQQVTASLSGTLVRQRGALTIDAHLQASHGQALAGPVLLDFAANPLTLDAAVERGGKGPVTVSRLDVEQRDLVRAHAEGVVRTGAHPGIASAHVEIASLELPAAYKSYLQLALATTDFGSLQSSGGASGSIDIANDALTRLDCSLHDVNFTDPASRVLIRHAGGDIHWVAAAGAAVTPSNIAWERAAAYDLSGGPVRLRFVAWQRNFALLGGDSRLPVLDGAVIVHTLVGRDIGTRQAEIDFNADVTPISMPRLSKAFGWPVMAGALSGHIPLVRYHDSELTFDGDLIAKVFDGTITGRQIVLRNPLGPWPSLSADVLARGLDLDLVTHTFALGSITGRVDLDITGLQLFDWAPVAFDARLYSTPGDRSRHRVSQNAVTRIAGLGGGGETVQTALESGALRFFHTFRYDRIGIGCRLRNEVCEMSGAAPAADGGYYLIAGSGLPRLDIIGKVRRVAWPQLIRQIGEGMREHNIAVSTGRK